MKKEQVIVTVSPQGEVTVEAAGVIGKGCEALTKPFEQALGTVKSDQKKPEYHQQASQPQKAGQQ